MYRDHRNLHVLTHSFPTRRSSDLRIDETVEFAGLERIVGARRASEHAHDLDAVIVAPQHPVWAEIEGLPRRMARDIGRKFDAQAAPDLALAVPRIDRSEEHTSELQSLMRISYAVFCLKKKK